MKKSKAGAKVAKQAAAPNERETVKVSSAGTLAIPKGILKSVAAKPGERFIVEKDGAGLRLVPVLPLLKRTVLQVAGCLHKTGRKAMTEAEMQSAVRAKAKASDQAAKSRK
ncbi:MAG: hypothetical protein Q8O52_28955 [Sulfuritalea sp.]|nr:hypothetical protein [Sulfuritalea sp.]